jgi:protein CLEC16A
VDEKHATWLHLRIRSPHQPLADVGKLGLPKTSPRVRHLVDGRWTLAFEDAEACKHACLFIQEQLAAQSHSVKLIVSPFLATDAVEHQ